MVFFCIFSPFLAIHITISPLESAEATELNRLPWDNVQQLSKPEIFKSVRWRGNVEKRRPEMCQQDTTRNHEK